MCTSCACETINKRPAWYLYILVIHVHAQQNKKDGGQNHLDMYPSLMQVLLSYSSIYKIEICQIKDKNGMYWQML